MKRVELLVVPTQCAEIVFEALGDSAGIFGDNGGDPDGVGPFLAPVNEFTSDELTAACKAGARIDRGWEVEYDGGNPDLDGNWCGYIIKDVAYTLSERVAKALERYTRNRRLQEE